MTMTPFCVYVAFSIHKSNRIKIGERQLFNKRVVYLTKLNTRKTPGLELVAFSRAKLEDDIAIGSKSNTLVEGSFNYIRQSQGNEIRCSYQRQLSNCSAPSQKLTIDEITNLDDSIDNNTFDVGCYFLLQWFNQKCEKRAIAIQN